MLILTINNVKLCWCFRKSGVLELWRLDHGAQYLKIYELPNRKNDEIDFCIALLEVKGIIYCCTNKGKLTLLSMNKFGFKSESGEIELPSYELQLCEPLSCFSISGKDQWVIACGGYGNHLQIYRLITPFNNALLTNNELFKILNYSAVHKINPIWVAKTNKKHKKELEEFPWLTDIVFMDGITKSTQETAEAAATDPIEPDSEDPDDSNGQIVVAEEGLDLCCVTQFGKLIYYNTAISQHSIKEITVSNHRIRKLQKLQTGKDLLFVDSFGMIGIIRNDSILFHYRLQNFGSLSGVDFLEIGDQHDNILQQQQKQLQALQHQQQKNHNYDDEDDDDLLQLTAKRQTHLSAYNLKKLKLNDLYVMYTTIIGEIRMIKLQLQNNTYDKICATRMWNSNNNDDNALMKKNQIYGVPCLTFFFNDDANEMFTTNTNINANNTEKLTMQKLRQKNNTTTTTNNIASYKKKALAVKNTNTNNTNSTSVDATGGPPKRYRTRSSRQRINTYI